MNLFEYQFFWNAVLSVLLMSVTAGIVGTYVVSRRMLFITGGITHASFGGLGLGLFAGLPPSLTALLFAILSAIGVEWTSRRGAVREDSAIAVFWSLGMALGIIFIFMTPGYTPGLTGFLFGNILTVTRQDLLLFAGFTLITAILAAAYNKTVIYTAFDRDFAKLRGINVQAVEYAVMLVLSVCVVLSIKLIGIMLLLSFLSLPQMTAELYVRRYNGIMFLSMLIAMAGGAGGLAVSLATDKPAGACIVFVLATIYMVLRCFKRLHNKKRPFTV